MTISKRQADDLRVLIATFTAAYERRKLARLKVFPFIRATSLQEAEDDAQCSVTDLENFINSITNKE